MFAICYSAKVRGPNRRHLGGKKPCDGCQGVRRRRVTGSLISDIQMSLVHPLQILRMSLVHPFQAVRMSAGHSFQTVRMSGVEGIGESLVHLLQILRCHWLTRFRYSGCQVHRGLHRVAVV